MTALLTSPFFTLPLGIASFIVTTLVASTGPLQDKDPYDGGMAVVSTAPTKARGNVVLSDDDDGDTQKVKLTTCYDKDCTSDATLTTSVQVFE